jgi:CRP/FNR family cyclic AMP-dependent transcriptional regulator
MDIRTKLTSRRSTAIELASLPLFKDFGPEDLGDIAALITVRTFRANDIIFRQDEVSDTFCFILDGLVIVTREGGEHDAILTILRREDFFGEMTLFEKGTHFATFRAHTDIKLGMISNEHFLLLLENDPRIYRFLISALTARLREANTKIIQLASLSMQGKLASLLIKLAEMLGEKCETGIRIPVRIKNADMGNMIGVRRETINRTLNKLWDDKVIDMRTNHLVILDMPRLVRIAQQ